MLCISMRGIRCDWYRTVCEENKNGTCSLTTCVPRFLFLEGLVYDLHQFLIHVLGPAFDRDELAVHDGNAVGVDGEQQLVILLQP